MIDAAIKNGLLMMLHRQRLTLVTTWLLATTLGCAQHTPPPTSRAVSSTSKAPGVGEKVPSEDDAIKDLHSLGVVDGRTNIFRCACPVRDIARSMTTTQPNDDEMGQARARMQRLYDLGVRTVISLQDPESNIGDDNKGRDVARAVAMEGAAASAVGIRYISRPIDNSGPHSLQTMSDDQVFELISRTAQEIIDDSKAGGVAFHCSAGHDRTGVVSAFIRMKYQHWSVTEAIAEMRRLGHNWPKYSTNGGISSWHEDHLNAIAIKLQFQQAHNSATTSP
jgi:Tyrosine phosphatase family